MAYMSGSTTYVELESTVPFIFRLPPTVLGITNWKATLLNKDDPSQIINLPNINVTEVGSFPIKAQVDGNHNVGSATLKVNDSSQISVGDIIRVQNVTYTVLAKNGAAHILTLDKSLQTSVTTGTDVKRVDYPQYLGVYRFTFTPSLSISPNIVGKFILTVQDLDGIVSPIEDEVEIVTTLSNTTGTNKIQAIQTSGMIG